MTNTRIWHLVARKLTREASLDEIREMEQILQNDPELAYQVEVFSQYYQNPQKAGRNEPDLTASWSHTLSKLQRSFPEQFPTQSESAAEPIAPSIIFPMRKKLAFAAGLLMLFSAGFLIVYNQFKRDEAPLVNQNPIQYEMKTMPGTRSRMILPDSTIVWLNSDSRITYNNHFGKNKREVYLTGEAFFDVYHNAEVPMVVHARSVNILVKGTAFNVRSYPDGNSVETSLIRGSVELSTDNDPDRKIILKPNEKITIEAKPDSVWSDSRQTVPLPTTSKPEYYHINTLKESAISNTIPEVSWVDNKLVFDNELFTDVLNKMSKWYNVEFTIHNETLALKKFSGAFDRETIYEALSALKMINHFEFVIEGNKVVIR